MKEEKHRVDELRWDDLEAFLAVARAGGLTSAAREIRSSAPTLGRRMRALERALGRELFIRRTHGYDLTEAGEALLDHLEGVAGQIARIAAPNAAETLPLVKVSAGTWTELALVRRLTDIAGDPADVRIRFVSSEAVLSIARREVTIAIRNQRPKEAGLAGRKLARNEFAVYATADSPECWIGINVDTPSARWAKQRGGQDVLHEATDPRVALDLALMGAGRIVLPTFIGDHENRLERVSDAIPELSHEAWLVVHDDDRHLPEVRRVVDRIAALRAS